MKVILYMAVSANGYIAKSNHETPWSDAEFASYARKVKEVGNLIIGKKTFDLMLDENAFAPLGQPFVVVLTSSKKAPPRENTFFVGSFEEAISVLEKRHFSVALVGGGGLADTAALESGLISEIFLDIEPRIFGKGIPLFAESRANLHLSLLGTKKIGESGVQLQYQVLKT